MTIQSMNDWSELRALGHIAAFMRDSVADAARPGTTTLQLDDLAALLGRQHGVRSAPQDEYDFPGFLCLSVNDAAVHGVPNDVRLQEGDLLTVDVTVSRGGYVVDTARTVELSSARATRLTTAADVALAAGLGSLRQASALRQVGEAISASVEQSGFHVLRQLCGHGVGRRIHEHPPVPNFADGRDDTVVWDGLVLAVEPIISETPTTVREDRDGWTLRTSNGCRAAHTEHTVVVTDGRPVILTSAALH